VLRKRYDDIAACYRLLAKDREHRRGGTLVTALVPQSDRARFESILDQSSVDIQNRRGMWQKSGWQRFDPQSQPYGVEEVRRERELYGSGLR